MEPKTLTHKPVPFRLHVDDRVLEDLRERLARTRWPDEALGEPWSTVDVPMGYVECPREISRPSNSQAARQYIDIRHWTKASSGVHFAALEQPHVPAHEIREFFHPLRAMR